MSESTSANLDSLSQSIRSFFEARLPQAAVRASKIKFLNIFPGHWFSTAASQCLEMHVQGHFYGSISVSQAYIEALGRFLADNQSIAAAANDPPKNWDRLAENNIIQEQSREAAHKVLNGRNDYHHLNDRVETDHIRLEARSLDCLDQLYIIECDVFSYTIIAGNFVPDKPRYWPFIEKTKVLCYLRNI